MTRAKRYEGEALRSDAWHRIRRDHAWQYMRDGMKVVESIIHNKFLSYAETSYDAENCTYNIVLQIGPLDRMGRLPSQIILFEHVESYDAFPSDHLMTKILLITGGTENA